MASYDTFLFIGHGKSKTGVFDSGATNGSVKEYDLNKKIVESAKKYLESTNLKVHYGEQNFRDKLTTENTYSSKAGITIHCNSSDDVRASGVEAWISFKDTDIENEQYLIKAVSDKLGISNRGVKSREYHTGDTYLRTATTKPPTSLTDYYGEIREASKKGIKLCLLETGFISNSKDLSEINAHIDDIGFIVANYVCMICNTTLPKPVKSQTYYRVIAESNLERVHSEQTVKALRNMGYEGAFIDTYEKEV